MPVLVRPVCGRLTGTPPDLGHLEAGDLPSGVEVRAIHAALERDRLGLEPGTDVAPRRDLLG